ncbi:hypothetical protein [Bdellovibrio sp. HCB209]|uniref:hypothetical protein n=1 Tax=Bdellovibrio sp. HCB209 TaxID=3394354 RepID=UPI0039B5AC04
MRIRNKKGNAIMQVLAAMAVMSISFYFLSSYVISQRKQVVKTKNVVNLKFAVNSAMDYVVFGIRQKYCFENGSLLNNTTACDWLHAGNVERLVMSDEQVQSLTVMSSVVDIGPHDSDLNKLALEKIDLMLNFPVSSAHPLFPIVQNLKTVVNETTNQQIQVKGIHVVLSRPANSVYLPKSGREVYVTAEVSLIDNDNKVIQVGAAPLTVRSQIVVYPRELGSFTLVLPGTLRLDQAWDATPGEKGQVFFHKYANRSDLGSSPGMVFLSPVFVNSDIVLPPDSGNASNSNYSPVTFADRVYMGNGWIYDSTGGKVRPFAPSTTGAVADRFWADSRVFGGFLRGIENDGLRDAGLDVLSGQSDGGASGDADLNNKCALLNQQSESLSLMAQSKVKAGSLNTKVVDEKSGRTMYEYQLGLSNQNVFVAQRNNIPKPNTDQWKTVDGKNNTAKWSRDDKGISSAIANVVIAYGNPNNGTYKEISTDLVRDGYVDIWPPVENPDRLKNLKSQQKSASDNVKNLESAGTSLSGQIDSLNSQKTDKDKEISTLNMQISDEMAKPVYKEPTPEPSPSGTPVDDSGSGSSSGSGDSSSGSSDGGSSSASSGSGSGNSSSSGSGSSSTTVDMTKYRDEAQIAKWNEKIDSLRKEISSIEKQVSDIRYSQIPANSQAVTTAKAALATIEAQITDYNQMVADPPQIRVDMDNVLTWSGRIYRDKILFQNFFEHMENLRDANGNHISNVSVRFKGYDGTYWESQPIDPKADTNHLTGYLNFKFDKNGKPVSLPNGLAANANTSGDSEIVDGSEDLAQKCEELRKWASSQSFGGAGWGTSFAGGTRKSWNFAGTKTLEKNDPLVATRTFTDDTDFQVYSIIGNCIIPPTTTFVTGFYTCDNLIIQGGRTKPLKIIGTIIVGKTAKIDEQAIKAGITWSTIYHPQATAELRARGILKPLSAPGDISKCDKLPSPIWHPLPSIQETADRMACNVISLRAKADPFKWTAVDPDCGFPPGVEQTTTSCKKRIVHYLVVEQSREGSGL